MKVIEVKIDEIKIGERHRKDLGDLDGFAQSIEAAELLQPIGVTPENELVFGLRRLLACRDVLGWTTIPARVIDVASIAHGEFVENTYRKDLAPTELVSLVEAVRGFSHGGDRRSDQARKSGVVSTEEACKRLGWSDDTFYRAKRVRDDGCEELIRAMDAKVVTVHQASELLDEPPEMVSECLKRLPSAPAAERRAVKKAVKRIKRMNELAEFDKLGLALPTSDDDIRLHHCKFQQLESVAGVAPGSAQLICTDIPYDKSFLPEIEELGRLAERVLVEGGYLVTYSGQYWLPQVLELLGKSLTYRWAKASYWDGDATPIYIGKSRISSKWKPILVFTKGDVRSDRPWYDVSHVTSKEKHWHPWQQPLAEAEKLIEDFSDPGGLVIDPCGGGFTTAIASLNTNRRFIGCDFQKEHVAAGQERLRLNRELRNFIRNFDHLGSNGGSVVDDWIAETGIDAEVASQVLRDMPDAELIKDLAIHVEDAHDLGCRMVKMPILEQWTSIAKVNYADATRCFSQLPDRLQQLFGEGPSTAA